MVTILLSHKEWKYCISDFLLISQPSNVIQLVLSMLHGLEITLTLRLLHSELMATICPQITLNDGAISQGTITHLHNVPVKMAAGP